MTETPTNDFGYCDIVRFNNEGRGRQDYRNDTAPWILKKLEKEYASLVQYVQVWETPSELEYGMIAKGLMKK